jgi:hypothetical protein
MIGKKEAFLIHLGISLVIFAVLYYLIVYVWYPAPFFDMDYRLRWLRIIAFVDIVLVHCPG